MFHLLHRATCTRWAKNLRHISKEINKQCQTHKIVQNHSEKIVFSVPENCISKHMMDIQHLRDRSL